MPTESVHSTGTLLHIDHDAAVATTVFRRVIEQRTNCRYLGVATSGRAGLEAARIQQPALVLLELLMPDIDGYAVAVELAKLRPCPRILLLTSCADEATLYRLGRGSVNGLVWKTERAVEELPYAIEEVLSGRSYFPALVLHAMRQLRCAPDCFFKILSDRELELVPPMGAGQSDREIAQAAGLSVATIHSHRQRIMSKLGLHTTAELMRWAVNKGFVHVPRPAPPCCLPWDVSRPGIRPCPPVAKPLESVR